MTKTYDLVGAPYEIYLLTKDNPTEWLVITELVRLYDKRINSVCKAEEDLAKEFDCSVPPIKNALDRLIAKGIIIRTFHGYKGHPSKYNIPLLDQYFQSKGVSKHSHKVASPKPATTPIWKNENTKVFISGWEKHFGKKVTQFSKDLQTKFDDLMLTTTPTAYLDWYCSETDKNKWDINGIAHAFTDGVLKRFAKASVEEKEEAVSATEKIFTPITFPDVLTKANFAESCKAVDEALQARDWYADYRQGLIDKSKGLGIIKDNYFHGTASIMEAIGYWENDTYKVKDNLSDQESKIAEFIAKYIQHLTGEKQ